MTEKKEYQTPDRPYYLDGHHFKPGDKISEEGLKIFKKHKAHTERWKEPKKKEPKK